MKKSHHLLEGLNPEQRKAVTHGRGPLLIIAGAGTGKTKVITHRIAYLISEKLARPEEILAVTFTEKAANEMEERVDVLIPYTYSFVEISTFNSFGERVLRNFALDLGFPPDFKLLDDVEQAIFFRENLFKLPLEYYRPLNAPAKHIQELLDAIKRLKQEDVRPQDYLTFGRDLVEAARSEADREESLKHLEMARVYLAYQDLLKAQGMIDFEDQVMLAVDLLRSRAAVLREFQQKYKYILVDEFQDTNLIQFELLKLLAVRHKNLTVCGDDDQSIFRFRGASLSNILNFEEVYPQAKKIVLTTNYRSTQAILDSAYRLIQQNNPDRLEFKSRITKKLTSTIETEGKSIHMLQFDTISHESDKVAETIAGLAKQGYRWSDMAILVRRNADADPFLRALNMKQIPFRFSGSRGLYSQEEIKILVSFIKALTDFEDSQSLFYLALSGIYQTDPHDLTVISNQARKRNVSLHSLFKKISEGVSQVDISPATEIKVKKIMEDFDHFIQIASRQNAGVVLFSFLERTGYLKSLVSEASLLSELRIKNIRLFFEKVKNYSELAGDDSVHAFAQHLDLLQQVGDNPSTAEAELEAEAVSVLTVHKAKGLEFEVVFLVGLIGDRFPGRERREKIPVPDGILKEKLPGGESYLQEERRLFYVGMTRAKKSLYLTWARDYGLKRLKKVSPFVLEALDIPKMPDEILRASALEEIGRYSPQVRVADLAAAPRSTNILTLSYFQVDDYLTCPLKYKYRHILKVPVLPHHTLVFGRVLHNVIHFYLRQKMAGKMLSEEELLREYERSWVNEGFLSREHEEMRKKAGEQRCAASSAARRRPDKSLPSWKKASSGRKARSASSAAGTGSIRKEGGAIIVDFKASEVKNQKEADKRTEDSLQMDLYALSFLKTQDVPLCEMWLYFLESDIIGRARKGEEDLAEAEEKIQLTEAGIRRLDFEAKPDWHNCNYCDFKTICPSSYAY